MKNKYFFITFEGIDGSGKSTQFSALSEIIRKNNNIPFGNKYSNVWLTREPTNITNSGRRIIELNKSQDIPKDKALKYYVKDRIEHSKIIKRILKYSYVLCSRYDMSTFTYQYVQGVNFDEIYAMHDYENGSSLIPDITLVFDLPVEVALTRCDFRKDRKLYFENEEFLRKAADAQIKAVEWWKKKDPERVFLIINANQKVDKVTEEMINKLSEFNR